jgi:hypothetical protein
MSDPPLATSLDRLLQDLEAEVEITHIGASALDRMLYALDPYESNETIMGQRKLLRIGRPRWARAAVKSGLFSAGGEVEVKGARIELPRLDRLSLSGLPGLGKFNERLAVMGPVIPPSIPMIIFAHTAKGITREGSAPKLQEFMRICLKYHPTNIGDEKQGKGHSADVMQCLICGEARPSVRRLPFKIRLRSVGGQSSGNALN